MFKKKDKKNNTNYISLTHANALINEAKTLSDTINTTTNEKEFYTSYERLITILYKLIDLENDVKFLQSPSIDLKNALGNREKAIEKFIVRKKEKEITSKNVNYVYHNEKIDPYLIECAKLVIEREKASVGIIQRHLNIGFNRAANIIDQLEAYGIVGPGYGTNPRTILMSKNEFESNLKNGLFDHEPISNPVYSYGQPNIQSIDEHIDLYNNKYDYMTGNDFEYYCADILKKNGFLNVDVTQGSGDHGIDILAEKDDITYAIQCKCYSSNIGNAAVQQAHTGKSLYHKDIAVVLTNQYFTQQAKEEAAALGVKLWDRDKLNDMIEKSSLNK